MPSSILFHLVLALLIFITACAEKFPPSEFETGQISLGSAYDLHVESNYAYVTSNTGMTIIDISDQSRPEETASYETNEAAFGILVEDEIAYLGSAQAESLSIVDVSDRDHPDRISSLDIPGTIYDIQKNANLLYLCTWQGKLYIVDISVLTAPVILSELDCLGKGTNLVYKDDRIYYANGDKGLLVIDVSDPASPEIIEAIAGTLGAWDIHLNNGFLYLGRHGNGFSIFSMEQDMTLTQVSSRNSGGEVYGIFQDGEYLYSGDLVNGVEIWGLGNMNQPLLNQTVPEYSPHDIVFHQGYIYLADQDRGFVILLI